MGVDPALQCHFRCELHMVNLARLIWQRIWPALQIQPETERAEVAL